MNRPMGAALKAIAARRVGFNGAAIRIGSAKNMLVGRIITATENAAPQNISHPLRSRPRIAPYNAASAQLRAGSSLIGWTAAHRNIGQSQSATVALTAQTRSSFNQRQDA